jgi:hypothetical protein
MIEVELPDGSVAEFPDGTPPAAIKQAIQKRFPPKNAPDANGYAKVGVGMLPMTEERAGYVEQAKARLDPTYSGLLGSGVNAATAGSQSGLMFGWDDEIGSAMMAPIHAGIDMVKGKGFDIGGAYDRLYEQANTRKQTYRQDHPVASTVGEIAGGLAVGGKAAQSGLTLAGRSLPVIGKTGAAALEGAAYGGLYGSGEAKPGERLEGAGWGALTGAATGALTERIGNSLAKRAAKKIAPPAPALDDLAQQTDDLYRAARAQGVTINAPAVDKMVGNIQIAAGGINDKLRPNTAGIVEDALKLKGQNLTLEALDEFRQQIGLAMKQAQPQDVRTLTRIKSVVDGLDNSLKAGDWTGPMQTGMDLYKQGRALNTRKAKTEVIEQLMDFADVDQGKYTQSGLANAIRNRSAQLYRQIAKGQVKGFTTEEVALIRQMAKGGSPSQIVNWLAKLAPRGVVSAALGQLMGASATAALGPAGMALNVGIPAAGALAAKSADKAALQAGNTLRDAAARGYVWRPPALPNKAMPFIGGATAGTTGLTRR